MRPRVLVGLCAAAVFLTPTLLFAEETGSLSMTLTPPLFQVTQAPGGSWSSVLRVVNTNDFDLAVTATVQDFHPDGETGNAVFSTGQPAAPGDTHLMSGWITVPSGKIMIKRGTTGEIPFTISVPSDADPGGHYAAILVATDQGSKFSGSGAGISSAISSLFFMRVPGEVIEEGAIRDFYAEQTISQSTDGRFVLRFENDGNVHLVPEGSIIITNMWGKERGRIEINRVNTFGNVLPKSTRKFEFDWHGESNLFEFGRYKALATLVYGESGRQSVSRVAYFWVIPWKQVLPIFGGLLFFVWVVTWSIRRYIRKALLLERERLGIPSPTGQTTSGTTVKQPSVTLAVLRRPLADEVDLRSGTSKGSLRAARPDRSWFLRYRPVIGILLLLAIGFALVGWYFVEVFQDERTYRVEQVKGK